MTRKSSEAGQLKTAIERMHGGTATLLERVPVIEKFQGQTAWRGTVHVFALAGHPEADTCYAWSSVVEGSDKRRYYAVLKIPPVVSPETAVRAAIVADHKVGRMR